MTRQFKDLLKRFFFRIHKMLIRFGIHILPIHYYSPIPNIIELEKTKDIWKKRSEMKGVKLDIQNQIENLSQICLPFENEYHGNKTYLEGVRMSYGPGYGYIEAQTLHAFIRCYKPKKIIEVGSGVSTYCMLKAIELNGVNCELTCIEPYPSDKLKELANQNKIRLINEKVQTVSPDVFERLEENDLLFIDSSHTVKPGSDVNFLFLEIMPRLNKGVNIHIHDIYFPFDFDRAVLKTFYHAMETSLLHAYLIDNSRIEIIFCLSLLHYDAQEDLKKIFKEYEPENDHLGTPVSNTAFEQDGKHFPSAIYLKTLN